MGLYNDVDCSTPTQVAVAIVFCNIPNILFVSLRVCFDCI